MSLKEKIESRTATIAIVGLGYVGLPIAVAFAEAGFKVLGVDIDNKRVEAINLGKSHIGDIASTRLAELVKTKRLSATSDYAALSSSDAIFICVPTPFTANKAPDLSYIVSATKSIVRHLSPGQLVMLQSTTHPGTTEEEVLPILETSGLKAGQDFYLAFSPERINPGDKWNTVSNTPKVVGGLTPACTEAAKLVLSAVTPEVHAVSSPRAAEMSKLLENIYRSVNIALVNELALLCERMGIDIWEVIEAASTKPFGFMPFYPGAGVGGHCIPVDPYYLSWKARQYDFHTKFIEFAAEVNQSMPYHIANKVIEALNRQDRPVNGANVLVLGVAFKKDIDDARNSPAERVIELLLERGAQVSYNDPYVRRFAIGGNAFLREGRALESVPVTDEIISEADCIVIITGHSAYDYRTIVDRARVIVDSCNATRGISSNNAIIVKLGTHS